MKREFLTNLGIEAETIEKIMAEHGKSITAKNTEIETLKGDIDTLKNTVEEHKKVDVEGITKELEEYKAKYNASVEEKALNNVFGKYEFTSALAKKAAVNEFKSQKFEMKDGEYTGFDDFMNDFIANNAEAFKNSGQPGQPGQPGDNANEPGDNNNPAYVYEPGNGSNNGSNDFEASLDNIF